MHSSAVSAHASVRARRAIDIIPDIRGPKSYGELADVALTRCGPNAICFVSEAHFLIIALAPQDAGVADERSSVFQAPAGSIEVIPAGTPFRACWDTPHEIILLAVPPERLQAFAAQEFPDQTLALAPLSPRLPDQTALQIARLMRDCLARPQEPNSRYMDSLKIALLLHMISAYSAAAEAAPRTLFRGGLPPRVWRRMEAHIAEHLAEDMQLADLAAAAGLSYSHFLRAFRQTSGMSPHRYIMLQRSQRARELAASTALPLKQVAIQCGFANQSHMTTVMRSLLSDTPARIRRQSEIAANTDTKGLLAG